MSKKFAIANIAAKKMGFKSFKKSSAGYNKRSRIAEKMASMKMFAGRKAKNMRGHDGM